MRTTSFRGHSLQYLEEGPDPEPMFESWEHESKGREFCLRDNDIVLDVGACIGGWSIPAAIIAKHVYAFEPNKEYCAILAQNADLNGLKNIDIIPKVIWNKNTTVAYNNWMARNGEASYPMTCTITLDSFCNDIKPDFIKIDVESAELKVLEGAQKTIQDFTPRIMVEVHNNHGITDEQTIKIIQGFDNRYCVKSLPNDGQTSHLYFECSK